MIKPTPLTDSAYYSWSPTGLWRNRFIEMKPPLRLHSPLWLASAESVLAQRRRVSERRQRRLFPILCLAAVATLVWMANFILAAQPCNHRDVTVTEDDGGRCNSCGADLQYDAATRNWAGRAKSGAEQSRDQDNTLGITSGHNPLKNAD